MDEWKLKKAMPMASDFLANAVNMFLCKYVFYEFLYDVNYWTPFRKF